MRPVRQRNRYSCGPTAIVNVRKWLGKSASYEDIKKVSKKTKTARSGTDVSEFHTELKRCAGQVKKRIQPSISEVNAQLKKGNLVVLFYGWTNKNVEGAHFGVFFKKTKKRYFGWNISRTKTVYRIGPTKMKKYLACPHTRDIAWFIKKHLDIHF